MQPEFHSQNEIPHREACRQRHRLLGHYLAIQAWLKDLDCIALDRNDLETFLGLKRFKSARIQWLREDLQPWFPYQVPYYKTNAESSISSLFLARVSIDKYLADGSMTTEDRISSMDPSAPKTALFLEIGVADLQLRHENIVSYLALLSSGLIEPSTVPYVKKRKRLQGVARLQGTLPIKDLEEFRAELCEELAKLLLGEKIPLDIVNATTGEIIVPANRRITERLIKELADLSHVLDIDPSPIRNKIRQTILHLESKHKGKTTHTR